MERKCLGCGAAISGPWGVVIFPDFKKGFCTLECWRKQGARVSAQPPTSAWRGPVVKYKWGPQGQVG